MSDLQARPWLCKWPLAAEQARRLMTDPRRRGRCGGGLDDGSRRHLSLRPFAQAGRLLGLGRKGSPVGPEAAPGGGSQDTGTTTDGRFWSRRPGARSTHRARCAPSVNVCAPVRAPRSPWSQSPARSPASADSYSPRKRTTPSLSLMRKDLPGRTPGHGPAQSTTAASRSAPRQRARSRRARRGGPPTSRRRRRQWNKERRGEKGTHMFWALFGARAARIAPEPAISSIVTGAAGNCCKRRCEHPRGDSTFIRNAPTQPAGTQAKVMHVREQGISLTDAIERRFRLTARRSQRPSRWRPRRPRRCRNGLASASAAAWARELPGR
jgi:hypothetical protein